MFKSITRSWQKHFSLQLLTLAVLSASYVMLILGYIVSKNAFIFATRWGVEAQMTVYLKDSVTAPELQVIESFLKTKKEIGSYSLVNKGQAAVEFQKQMQGIAPELASDPDIENFLPLSYHVSLAKEVLLEEQATVMRGLSELLKTFSMIEDVSFGENWIQQYSSFFATMRGLGSICLIVFLLALVFVMGNSIRNSIMYRREEIEILELVGSTQGEIRQPFVFEGIFINFVSVVMAVSVTALIFIFVKDKLLQNLLFVGVGSEIQFLSIVELLVIFCLSIGLGSLASYLSVRSINSGWAAVRRSKNV